MPDSSIHPFSTHSTKPQEYNNLINELNEQVSAHYPDDILQFCFDFFEKKLAEERAHHRNPTFAPGIYKRTYTQKESFFFFV